MPPLILRDTVSQASFSFLDAPRWQASSRARPASRWHATDGCRVRECCSRAATRDYGSGWQNFETPEPDRNRTADALAKQGTCLIFSSCFLPYLEPRTCLAERADARAQRRDLLSEACRRRGAGGPACRRRLLEARQEKICSVSLAEPYTFLFMQGPRAKRGDCCITGTHCYSSQSA
jgi:hypothetical protein